MTSTSPIPTVASETALPTALRNPTIADLASDAMHIHALSDTAFECLLSMEAKPFDHNARERLGSLLWILRDLAEALEWKADRVRDAQL